MGSLSSHKHHPLLSPHPLPLPSLSEWMLSTGAYLRRDGKGTEERKSILYLTTKHNPNQKQLEFAGCSINWTASSGWPLCRWIATVMHYSTMAKARACQTQRYTHTHKQKTPHIHRDKQHAPRGWGIATAMRKTLMRQEQGWQTHSPLLHKQGKAPLDHLAHPYCGLTHICSHTHT